ncbi:pentapeptide repeat-containing protein [Clostridium sp. MCC353]|uniref:pentapeptide repeat-containing protein n=1 Tax=Clostridium sp. MCC353 TaxID=2592646 RepID=UPI001C01B248|nr:pentapeptide repeat-containing protein [Clostridium sp. MCC353]MBT9778963.1 pentapeptide repeat-containing protein [Clostridium sp. MCC353]
MTKLIEPWMPPVLEKVTGGYGILRECCDNEERLEEKHITKLEVQGEVFNAACVSKVKFENCLFLDCSFKKGEFTDVIFQSCNFSNCDFSDSYFNRCQFTGSKGMGAKFCGSSIQNLAVRDCNFNYANFDSSKLEKILVEDTELRGANLSQCKCKGVDWNRVRLQEASFFKTPLQKMDFRTCDITALSISDDCSELKGAVVDLYQAAELAKRFGLVIK